MAGYNWTQKVDDGTYTVQVAEPDLYGYFEHNTMGEDRGGGLWFTRDPYGKLELTDYDGVAVLPKRVIQTLRDMGHIVDPDFE